MSKEFSAMPSTAPVEGERFLNREEAAELIGVRPQTLANWATTQKHLPLIKVGGRHVRYARAICFISWSPKRSRTVRNQ